MKQRVNFQTWWRVLVVVVAVAGLNLGTQSKAQTLHWIDAVLLSEKTDNTPSNISARDLFRDAYQNRYTWGPQFPGYTAAVEVRQGKELYKGRIRLNPNLRVEVMGIDNEDARQSVENQLGMIATHRRRVPFEVAHKNSTFKLGAKDTTEAVEILQQGDKTAARFKVLNHQIKQVNRILGPHSVSVDTLDTEVTPEGYLATHYRTIFSDPQTKKVLGEMESQDSYKKVGDYYVLTRQVTHISEQGEQTSTELNFTDIQPLSGSN